MKILALSDKLLSFIYSSQVNNRFPDVDLIIGCGDLPYYYLEYVLTKLRCPCLFVRGNHDKIVEYSSAGQRTHPHGGTDLHRRVHYYQGAIFAGVEGSVRYRKGPFQYSQSEMWLHVWKMTPRFMLNRMQHGRYLDVFVAHAPPEGIHDREDLPHQGIKAFRWMIDVFQPTYFLHGHIHLYRPDEILESQVGSTQVINAFPHRELDLNLGN